MHYAGWGEGEQFIKDTGDRKLRKSKRKEEMILLEAYLQDRIRFVTWMVK